MFKKYIYISGVMCWVSRGSQSAQRAQVRGSILASPQLDGTLVAVPVIGVRRLERRPFPVIIDNLRVND